MKPVVKVLIVVLIVLVVVHFIRRSKGTDSTHETYARWTQQEFETVPPKPFAVTDVPLVVDSRVMAPAPTTYTAAPVLTEVAGALPATTPTMVPTFLPTVLPSVVTTSRPDGTRVPVMPAARSTMAPVVTYIPTATPSLVRV